MLSPEERAARDAAIRQFVDQFAAGPNSDLYAGMLTTICRLANEKCGRGELKILDTTLKELRYAFKVFSPYTQTRKVSIFGSSRTHEDHDNYTQATRFAERIRQESWMVITGAGDGIMKAGHGGAGKEASFGVAIRLPFEQRTNTIIAEDEKLIQFKYFFTRKLMFIKEASAVALFPGGFGTQDEGFEALTLVQTGKASIIPIVMVEHQGGTYWQHWRAYVAAELLRNGMISPEDMHLFHITDDVEDAVQHIVRFFRMYHSSRYLNDLLVLRLNARLPEAAIDQLNSDFSDILVTGRIEQATAAAPEGDEFPDKPRLVMRFNRHGHGRLRRMIDQINDMDMPIDTVAQAPEAIVIP